MSAFGTKRTWRIVSSHYRCSAFDTQKFRQAKASFPQLGRLKTVGIDVGVIGGGLLAWGVYMPTQGPPQGSLAGTYAGASGDIAVGVGAGANVLLGGSGRSVMLQPISVEGSVGIDVTLGVSALTLQWVP